MTATHNAAPVLEPVAMAKIGAGCLTGGTPHQPHPQSRLTPAAHCELDENSDFAIEARNRAAAGKVFGCNRLFFGASILALCVGSSALAQQQQTVLQGATLPAEFSVDVGETVETGVVTTGSPTATSTVNSIANGTIEQTTGGHDEDDGHEEGGGADHVGALDLANAGSVSLTSAASAINADGHATSFAQLTDGITQKISASQSPLSAHALNTGTLVISASALAEGTDFGGAIAGRASSLLIGGFHQEATVEGSGNGSATAAAINEGLYRASSTAQAGAQGDAQADATLEEALFMRAQANGAGDGTTLTTFENAGQLEFFANALGSSSDGNAGANAMAGGGHHGLIHIRGAANGVGDDNATVVFSNDAAGSLAIDAIATANALTQADAFALADGALVLKAQASGKDDGVIVITLENDGLIGINAASAANSSGAEGGAIAATTLNSAIVQIAEAGGPAQFVGRTGVSTINNNAGGSILVAGTAQSVSAGISTAQVDMAPAILQEAELTGAAETHFNNAGDVTVTGTATATGDIAHSGVNAGGVEHEIFGSANAGGAISRLTNSGALSVAASAQAVGTSAASADAAAIGFKAWGEPVTLALANGGSFSVSSAATAVDGPAIATAIADAIGMGIYANFNPTIFIPEEEEEHGHGGDEGHSDENGQNGHGGDHEDGPVVWEEEAANTISGSIDNSGLLSVSAVATGATTTSSASGISFESAVNNSVLTNSGTISVSAASNGGISQASGIVLRDFVESPIEPGAADVFTLVNDGGTIIARQSTDLGASWARGLAIDTSQAPNRVDLRFTGSSNVFGHVDISADDRIIIAGGETRLDGLVNPDFALEGRLSIGSGATLVLADPLHDNPDYDGPAGAYLDTLELADGATLALELPVTSGGTAFTAAAAGMLGLATVNVATSYPQIFADEALLNGTLQVRPHSANGLYDDIYLYPDIIDANVLHGGFSQVETFGGSPLLAPAVFYDAQGNVDLLITRVDFGDAAGLSDNQAAIGDGIEGDYSPLLDGAYGTLLAQLFALDADGYAAALDQISGDQYAGYAQNLRDFNLQTNALLSDQLDCALSGKGIEYCRNQDQGLRFHTLGGFNEVGFDSDGIASGYDADNWFALVGFDYTTGNFSAGAFGGLRQVEMQFDRNNGMVDAEGFQLGLTASYDVGDVYLRGNGSFSSLEGDSRRSVAVGPIAGTISGAPDAQIWSFFGEAGARVALGQTWLTPFAAVDHTSVSIDAFTESGVAGANLDFPDQTDSQTSLLAGLKWAGTLGPLSPEAKLAYRHDFGDPFLTSTAGFADAPGGSLFSVRAPGMDQDSVMAGFSLASALTDQVTARLGYQGRFGGGVDDHAYFGSLVMRFGASGTASAPRLAGRSGSAPSETVLRLGLDLQGIYSDNIFATRNDKIADFILTVRPSARLKFGDRSTYLEVGGRGYLARNEDRSSENFSDWTLDLDSRLKLNDAASLIFDGEYRWAHESRTSPEAVFGLTPTLYESGRGVAGLLLRQGALTGRFAGSLTRYDFSDVATSLGTINNDDRDRTEAQFVGRVGYDVAQSTKVFMQASFDDTQYKTQFDDFGFERNSQGVGAVVGLGRTLGGGFSGEVFAGLLERSYNDPAFQDVSTFDLGLLVDWAGARSNASLRVDRSIEESISFGASGYVLTNGSLSFSTAAGPRLAAGVTLGGAQYNYNGVERREFVINSDLWTRYWLGKHLFAGVGYHFTQRASNAAGYSYDENRMMLTIGSQLRPRYLDNAAPLNWSLGDVAPGGAYGAIFMGHGTLATGVTGPRDLQAASTADFGDDGAAYGLAIGYGTVLDPIYLGLEVAGTLDGPSWQHESGRNFSVEKDNGLELAARVGYVTPARALVFGRLGIASAKFTTDYVTVNDQTLLEDRRTGLSVGFGVETPASQRSFVRAEYVITGYQDYDVPLGTAAGDNFSSVEGQFRLGVGIRLGQSAERAETTTDFSGTYAGLSLGHGALTTRTIGAREDQPMLAATRSSHGGVLGGFTGYGWLVGDLYFGAEIEADVSNIDWNLQSDPDGRSYSSRHQYSFGAGARFGHRVGQNALGYVRVGAIKTRFDTTYRTADILADSKDTRTGLQLGGGIELGLGATSRLRVEYIINKYEKYDVFYGQDFENFDHSEAVFRTGLIFGL